MMPVDLWLMVPAMFLFGAVLTWGAFFWTDGLWERVLLSVVGSFLIWGSLQRLLCPGSVLVPNDGSDVVVRSGFLLMPTRLLLDREKTAVDYQVGSDTDLHKSLGGFKNILLRHVETEEVAHLTFSLKNDDALRVFDALTKVLASGGRNTSQAVITNEDGSMLRVDRLATWQAGQWRSYHSQISTVGNAVVVTRRAYGENRNVLDRSGDDYPIRIEPVGNDIRISYSKSGAKSYSWDDCICLQMCREEIPERATRYEINLIEDYLRGNRINLLSVDVSPFDSLDEFKEAAAKLGDLLELEVVDHL